jgi:cytochrome c-type biogenesis protein CcmE
MTVEELLAQQSELQGKKLRISGAVLGDSIQYDPASLDLSFQVAQISGDHREIEQMGGMAKALEDAVKAALADPSIPRITIHYYGVRPDLLQDEAQAIVTGLLDENGDFQASELLLKCPSKYESALPKQAGE